MKKLFIVTTLVAAIFIVACNSNADNLKNLTANDWHLEEVIYDGNDFTETPPSDVTIIFTDSTKSVWGKGGCNGYFSAYTVVNDDQISFGHIGSTMMACPHMQFEYKYLEALGEVDKFKATKKELRLIATAQGTTLVYKPVFKAVE